MSYRASRSEMNWVPAKRLWKGRSNERALTEKEILRLLRRLPPEDIPAARKLLEELEKGGRS